VVDEADIQLRYEVLDRLLDERVRRSFAAAEAKAAGRGGVLAVSRITGIARSTILRGLAELSTPSDGEAPGRVRRPGGGRKKLTATDATLLSDLRSLVEPTTRATRRRRCDGPAVACAIWRRHHGRWGIA